MSKFTNWWSKTFFKFKRWLKKVFYGIYGIDDLYFVLTGLLIVLIIINALLKFWGIWILEAATLVYMIFRAMSHNIPARRRENAAFFGSIKRLVGFFRLSKNRFRDRKTHIYRKCPKCRAVLRLPKAKGKHTAVCPKCSNRFEVK